MQAPLRVPRAGTSFRGGRSSIAKRFASFEPPRRHRNGGQSAAAPVITEREQLELASTAPYSYDGNGRRTVHITGRGAERNLPVTRPTLRRHEREGFKPDRAAMWAVLLGVLLILVAATSAHAAVLVAPAAPLKSPHPYGPRARR